MNDPSRRFLPFSFSFQMRNSAKQLLVIMVGNVSISLVRSVVTAPQASQGLTVESILTNVSLLRAMEAASVKMASIPSLVPAQRTDMALGVNVSTIQCNGSRTDAEC